MLNNIYNRYTIYENLNLYTNYIVHYIQMIAELNAYSLQNSIRYKFS